MPKAFISYKHDANPDVRLANAALTRLRGAGHQVFIDSQILVGDEWPTVIEDNIKTSDYLIVFLSPASAASEMVIEEIRIARRVHQQQGRPKILPVRVGHEDPLPYDLGAWLDRLQQVFWRSAADDPIVFDQLEAAMGGADLPSAAPDPSTQRAAGANPAPLPAFDQRWLEDSAGAVRVASPFYVERDLDGRARQAVLRCGETILIRGSRQSGKSSALARLCRYAKENGQRVLFVDFQGVDKSRLQDLDALLRYLADFIYVKLRTSEGPERYWATTLGPTDKLSSFVEMELLQHAAKPCLLALDEVDRIFTYPQYSSEFFGLLRSWHNKRAFDEVWNNLNLVLAYSTESSMLILDQNQSPFNVGESLESTDFTQAQVLDLNRRHGSPLNAAGVGRLMDVVSGHPYLVRKALFVVTTGTLTLDALVACAADDDGPFGDHLQRNLVWLARHQELRASFKELLQTAVCDSDLNFYQLRAVGLVRGHSRQSARPRCGLYRSYFTVRL